MDPLKFSIHPAADGSDLGLGGGFFFQGKQAKSAATFVLDIHTKSLRRKAHNLADINIRYIKKQNFLLRASLRDELSRSKKHQPKNKKYENHNIPQIKPKQNSSNQKHQYIEKRQYGKQLIEDKPSPVSVEIAEHSLYNL